MTHIKICGIKALSDALASIEAGADYLGFNFYTKSVRYVDVETCSRITAVLKKEHPQVKLVGIFVNSSADEIKTTLETCSLDLAQLHGDESPELLRALNGKAFKAFRGLPSELNGFSRCEPPALLVDAVAKETYGGSGLTADWPAVAELAKRYPLLLAGGLTPENIAGAVRQVKPWGVDVASGVEAGPGRKDAAKLSAFVQTVRQVENQI